MLAQNELGVTFPERSIDRTETLVVEEFFLRGTAADITAATMIDHPSEGTGKMGPVTTQLRTRSQDVFRGRNPKYKNWNAAVFSPPPIAGF